MRWIEGKTSRLTFMGWGMTTMTNTPWTDPMNNISVDFLRAHNNLVTLVRDGKFKLSQFDTIDNKEVLLRGLMWRHFIVYWSARYASFTTSKNLAECGVCDGLTIYFALSAVGDGYKAWLYDAWEAMDGDRLLASEQAYAGDYGYLSIDQTKTNLAAFDTVFIKGFIPESFTQGAKPSNVAWLHIDLNASTPTLDSLNEFYNSMPSGGVILFDDYASKGFVDTKKIVDAFFSDKKGIFLHVPTGQGIFFRK
jgi:hypothetical protein